MRLGYLYSRYPVISHTFCDMEMLALDRFGLTLEIGSIYSPLTSLRHQHISRLRAPIHYAPPQPILCLWEKKAKARGKWPGALVDLHECKYGPRVKAEQRARNALYFADLFTHNGVDHVHVHFANRAAHTALFLKEISGNDELLREICAAAEFVAAETDYSRELLCQRCPDSAAKLHRVYNGIDLEWFPSPLPAKQTTAPHILSVGRLVAFKGFERLIDACAELTRRSIDFTCEIIGNGPLRENLEAKIDKLNLSSRVALLGSLSQGAVFDKLRAADIFALASVVDSRGASDIFPTVILEAMSAARPVVSTRLAGIPESVVHEETGLLVPPADTAALADALERLIGNPRLRLRYGNAGRARIEQHFRIEQTIAPLLQLLQRSRLTPPKPPTVPHIRQIAYLIDRWPDQDVPFLERELHKMTTRNIPIVPFVCEFNSTTRFTRSMKRLADRLEFLSDAMAIEAEWRANRTLTQQLEEARAQEEVRAPDAIFLRQARFALTLRKLLAERRISHVHATSSRALVCALILQSIVDLTVSATIEPHSALPQNWIRVALRRCEGGRLSDRRLLKGLGKTFLFDRAAADSFPKKIVRLLGQKSGIDLTKRANFWQEWSELLLQWSRAGRDENKAQ